MREDEEKEIEERFDREMKEFLDEMAAGLGVDLDSDQGDEFDLTDEEEDELFAPIDAIIEQLRMAPDTTSVSVENMSRVRDMKLAYQIIKQIFQATKSEVDVTYRRHEFDANAGVLRIEGSPLSVVDMEGFATVAGLADNMEIYPLEVNKLRMAYMFYGLLTRIGEIE